MLEYLGTCSSPDEIQVISVIMGPSCYNPWNMENQGTNRDIAFLFNFGGVTNRSSLPFFPGSSTRSSTSLRSHRASPTCSTAAPCSPTLESPSLPSSCLVRCILLYILYIFGVHILWYIYGAVLYLAKYFWCFIFVIYFWCVVSCSWSFFDASITFFGIVCFVEGALCCILLLVYIFWSGQNLVWNVGFPVAFTYLERFEPWEAISQTSRQRSREKWGLLFSKAENTPTPIASMFSESFTSRRNLRMDSTARSRWHIAWWGGKVTI